MRSRVALLIVAVAGAVALVFTGCASQAPDPTPSSTGWVPSAFPQTTDEYGGTLAECLRASGWEITSDPDDASAFSANVPPGQDDRYAADLAECSTALGPAGDVHPSEELARKVYDLDVEWAHCLADHGYAIAEIPSFATFFDDIQTQNPLAWSPMVGLQGPEFQAAEKDCPRPDYPLR